MELSAGGEAKRFRRTISCQNPFIDGNKSAGAAAALGYLALYNYEFCAQQHKLANFVFSVACSEVEKADAVLFIRKLASRQKNKPLIAMALNPGTAT